jgi:hypothetical protein
MASPFSQPGLTAPASAGRLTRTLGVTTQHRGSYNMKTETQTPVRPIRRGVSILGLAVIAIAIATALTGRIAHAQAKDVKCFGNTETGDKKVLQAGIQYLLWYRIEENTAKVRVAGRELSTKVDRGSSWKGPWLKLNTEQEYFSFLPEEGGTLKFQLDKQTWYIGNCR